MKKFLLLLTVVLLACAVHAQDCTVRGVVTDKRGDLLAGVNVAVDGAPSVGTATDGNGEFTLDLSGQDCGNLRLVFTYVGLEQKVVELKENSVLSVVMQEHDLYDYYVRKPTFGVRLQGNTDYTPFGAGVFFRDIRLRKKSGALYHGNFSYHAGFSENSEIHARLVRVFSADYNFGLGLTLQRYDIAKLETDQNVYGFYFFKKIGAHSQVSGRLEYASRNYEGQEDELSLVAGWLFWFRNYSKLQANGGISQDGKGQFEIQGTIPQIRGMMPVCITASGGYWIDDWRWNAELIRFMKMMDIAVGYKHLFGGDNFYLRVDIPLFWRVRKY